MIARPKSIGQAWRIMIQMEGELKMLRKKIIALSAVGRVQTETVKEFNREFCSFCGASIPHRYGEGRCNKCMEHFDESTEDYEL